MKKSILLWVMLLSMLEVMAGVKVKWALYNVKGNGDFHEGLSAYRDPSSSLYGYMDNRGKIVIPAQYDRVGDFNGGVAVIETSTGQGLIDRSGKVLLPPHYKSVKKKGKGVGLYEVVDSSRKYGLFMGDRMIISPEEGKNYLSDYLYPFVENRNLLDGKVYSMVNELSGDLLVAEREEGGSMQSYVFDRTTGKEVTYLLKKESKNGLVRFRQGDQYGLKNARTGQIVLEPTLDWLSPYWVEDHLLGTLKTENSVFKSQTVLINSRGKIEKSEDLLSIYESYLVIKKYTPDFQSTSGLYTIDGKELLAPQYEQILHVYKNWFWVVDKDKSFLLDGRNQRRYAGESFSYSNGVIRAFTKGAKSAYLIHAETGMQIGGEYSLTRDYSEGLAVVEKQSSGEKVVIDQIGNVVLSEERDGIVIRGTGFHEGVLAVIEHGTSKKGYIYNPLATKCDYAYYSPEPLPGSGIPEDVAEEPVATESTAVQVVSAIAGALKRFGNSMQQGTGEGVVQDESTYGNATVYGGEVYTGNTETEPASTEDLRLFYQSEYDRWERLVERCFKSITVTGVRGENKKGDPRGTTLSGMGGVTFTGMQNELTKAQREMRKVRLKAQRKGITIPQSRWENAQVKY